MIPDPAPPYEFGCSAALAERIQRMIDVALAHGFGPDLEYSIAFIVDQLINDHRGWGDPVRRLQHAKLIEYHGRFENLLAIYAVHDRIPIVFLSALTPMPDHPLFGEVFDGQQ